MENSARGPQTKKILEEKEQPLTKPSYTNDRFKSIRDFLPQLPNGKTCNVIKKLISETLPLLMRMLFSQT